MRGLALVLIVAVGCGQEPPPDPVDRRRTALRLDTDPVTHEQAMEALEPLELRLKTTRDPQALIDLALRVENLLARTAFSRDPGLLEASRAAATELARRRSVAARDRLLEACTACHVKHREER